MNWRRTDVQSSCKLGWPITHLSAGHYALSTLITSQNPDYQKIINTEGKLSHDWKYNFVSHRMIPSDIWLLRLLWIITVNSHERHDVSNLPACFTTCSIQERATIKVPHCWICTGKSIGYRWIPRTRARNAESVSRIRCHHVSRTSPLSHRIYSWIFRILISLLHTIIIRKFFHDVYNETN